MDIKKISYFLEIVKAKSIASASKKLSVDQSILSRALRSLEEDLKTELYVHFDKTFKLTNKGKLAHKYFKKVINICSDLEKNLSSSDNVKCVDLNVSTTNGMVNYFLIDNLCPFLEDNTNIHLSFLTNDLVQKLDVGIDICIGPKIEGDSTESFYLFSYYLKMYSSQKYLEKYGYPQQPEDLDSHKLIAYSREDISTFIDFDWHLRFGSFNGTQRKPYLQVSSSYALQRAAQHHLGIITFSKHIVKRDCPDLIDIFPTEKGLKVDIYFSYRTNKDNLDAILLYRDYLYKYFRSLPFHED